MECVRHNFNNFYCYHFFNFFFDDIEPEDIVVEQQVQLTDTPKPTVIPLSAPSESPKVTKKLYEKKLVTKPLTKKEPEPLSQEELFEQMVDKDYLEKGRVSREVASYIYCRKFYKDVLEQEFCEEYHSNKSLKYRFSLLTRIIDSFGGGNDWSVDATIDINSLLEEKYSGIQSKYQMQQAQCSNVACTISIRLRGHVKWQDFDAFKSELRSIGFESVEFSRDVRNRNKLILLRYPMSESHFGKFWRSL